jgi:hypothetical protein
MDAALEGISTFVVIMLPFAIVVLKEKYYDKKVSK